MLLAAALFMSRYLQHHPMLSAVSLFSLEKSVKQMLMKGSGGVASKLGL